MGGRSLGVPRLIGARVGVPHSHWSVGGCSFGHPHSDWSVDGHLLGIPAPIGSWVGAPSSNWALIGHLPGRPLCDWLRDRHSLGIASLIGPWAGVPPPRASPLRLVCGRASPAPIGPRMGIPGGRGGGKGRGGIPSVPIGRWGRAGRRGRAVIGCRALTAPPTAGEQTGRLLPGPAAVLHRPQKPHNRHPGAGGVTAPQ